MKKIIFILSALLIGTVGFSQRHSILDPITPEVLKAKVAERARATGDAVSTTLWAPQLAVTFNAQAVNLKEKPLQANPIASTGYGLSWTHNKLIGEEVYTDISVTALVLTSVKEGEMSWGAGLTAGLFNNKFQVGVGYIQKAPQFLFGVNIVPLLQKL